MCSRAAISGATRRRLHAAARRQRDAKGKVIGAGVLTLGVDDLVACCAR